MISCRKCYSCEIHLNNGKFRFLQLFSSISDAKASQRATFWDGSDFRAEEEVSPSSFVSTATTSTSSTRSPTVSPVSPFFTCILFPNDTKLCYFPLSVKEGAMVEPLAVAMHAVQASKMVPGDSALVVGPSPPTPFPFPHP